MRVYWKRCTGLLVLGVNIFLVLAYLLVTDIYREIHELAETTNAQQRKEHSTTNTEDVRVPNVTKLVLVDRCNSIDSENVLTSTGHTNITQLPRLDPNVFTAYVDTWHELDPRNHLHIFNAYSDERSAKSRVIRIISIGLNNLRLELARYTCQYWYRRKSGLLELGGFEKPGVEPIPESGGRPVRAHFILCPLANAAEVPDAVSLATEPCISPPPGNLLGVLREAKTFKYKFAVCVTPLNYHFGSLHRFVEKIEIDGLMGAQHFTFYNHTLNNSMAPYIRTYQNENLVEIVQWKLPADIRVDHWPPQSPEPNIHYFAQLAALNDCLMRHRGVAEYVAFTDIDEFIIPHLDRLDGWAGLIGEVDGPHPLGDDTSGKRPGAYLVQNTFFKLEYPDEPTTRTNEKIRKWKIYSLLKTNRENVISPLGSRSKFILKPSAVETVGVHNIWKLLPGYRAAPVSTELALLHHYRYWATPNDKKHTKDLTMLRFQNEILGRIENRYRTFGSEDST